MLTWFLLNLQNDLKRETVTQYVDNVYKSQSMELHLKVVIPNMGTETSAAYS